VNHAIVSELRGQTAPVGTESAQPLLTRDGCVVQSCHGWRQETWTLRPWIGDMLQDARRNYRRRTRRPGCVWGRSSNTRRPPRSFRT